MNHRAEKAIEVLIRAFFKGTLKHGDCARCAVGNLVLASRRDVFGLWYYLISKKVVLDFAQQTVARHQLDSTNYSDEEITKIERAFESGWLDVKDYSIRKTIDVDSFLGLCAVFDVLCDIDRDYFESRVSLIEMAQA